MKKFILSAVVMLASVASYAQHAVGTLTLQPKVGLNIASLSKADGADPRIGVAVGAELEYQVADIVSVSAGALYSMQGNKVEANVLGFEASATNKLDYINVPILANVYVAKGLAVKLGLQPGFKVNSSSDYAKSVDLSIPVGLSYEYNNIVLDGRYNFGVTKAYEAGDYKNSVFQITLGYKFAL